MVFLTQDGTQLVEVGFVEIKSDEKGFYLFGYTDKSLPIKLGLFDSEEKAKAVLHQAVSTGLKIIPTL